MRFASAAAAATIRIWVALRSAFIAVVAWTGAGLLGMHKVAQPMLGWSIWTTFAVVIPIILFYVLISGYIGVVFSDLFEGLVVIAKSLLLCVLVLWDFGGPSKLGHALVKAFGEQAVSWHPPSSHEMLGAVGVMAWIVGTTIGYGGDAAPMGGAMEGQRILSCKNAREASKMYIWTQVVLFGMLLSLTLPALGAMVRWPGLHNGSIDKEMAYGMLLAHYLPPGLLGLGVSAILASIMSAVSSNMNFGAQVFVNDVYKRAFVKEAAPGHYVMVGRFAAAAIVLLAIGVATVARDVIDITVFMLGLSSAELTANWAQWWWWRFNGKARLAASIGGPAIFLVNHFIFFRYVIHVPGGDPGYWIVFLSMGQTLVLWVAVALLTEPEPEPVLVEFYKRAKPMGWWGPIAAKAGEQPASAASPIFTGLGVAVMGAVTTASGTITLTAAFVGRWGVAALAGIIALAFGLLFKTGYSRYMDRIEATLDESEIQLAALTTSASP